MQLDGIHHITAITADARSNLDFYGRVLGLRLVKKTVNQDDPSAYHLFYADEAGSPGADLTFFEYPGARRGRPGAGMIHRIVFRVADEAAIGFWEQRLRSEGLETFRNGDSLRFADPEDLDLELVAVHVPDAPLVAAAPDVPPEHALRGFHAVRAYSADPTASADLLESVLGMREQGEGDWEVRGPTRGGGYAYDRPPETRGHGGAGTVHHVAFSTEPSQQDEWAMRLQEAGVESTPVIDRFYFRSIYFREPSGVLFELATKGPGFAVDEPLEMLGERLSLPPDFEPFRSRIEQVLRPLPSSAELRERAGASSHAGGG